MAVGLVVVTVAVGLALHVTSVAPEILWSVKVRQAAAHHLPQLDDYISDDELRWTTWTRSVIHCADLCARDVTCLAFTATTVTSRGVECRGHCGLGPGSTLGNRANTRAYSLQGKYLPLGQCTTAAVSKVTTCRTVYCSFSRVFKGFTVSRVRQLPQPVESISLYSFSLFVYLDYRDNISMNSICLSVFIVWQS